MAGLILETPSRIWRRLEAVEGQDMPSLPSLPGIDDSEDQPSLPSESMDLSHESSPYTSTPATVKTSNTMATIRPPGSAGSTVRFAHSIASRSSKSSNGPSVSRASVGNINFKHDKDSFDISLIPSLPHAMSHDQLGDSDARSSDQESHNDQHPVADAYLPPVGGGTDQENDFDLSEALRPISRSNSPGPDLPGATPMSKKKYDYSVSLRSEPQPSPFDRLRNVSIRRPLSRNARTPSLTSNDTPSPTSSLSSQPTPQSLRSQRQRAPSPAHVPIPRSATASPMPQPTVVAPLATTRPLAFNRASAAISAVPAQTRQEDQEHTIHTVITEAEDDILTSLPPLPSPPHEDEGFTLGTNIHTQSEASAGEREPTFSSEENTQASRGDGADTTRYQSLSPQSSPPMRSELMTPTPAFGLRPRARFNANPIQQPASTTPPDPPNRFTVANSLPQMGLQDAVTSVRPTDSMVHAVPATPATTHKKSFLLSVINSTARPRMKFPTPHPPRREEEVETPAPSVTDSEEDGHSDTTVRAPPRTAFAGATPRVPRVAMRPRLSHPLTQAWTAPRTAASPEPLQEGASIISTASSQDLAMHRRANQSCDPVIGLGDRGHGVGRFNAGKLNTYLHGLNRRLEEENEGLVARLREYEEKFGNLDGANTDANGTIGTMDGHHRRYSSGGRRVSAGPNLGAVTEDWNEEKAALEDVIDELKQELETTAADRDHVLNEKDGLQRVLDEERAERARDKERFVERLNEAKNGMQTILDDVDKQMADAARSVEAAEKDKIQTVKEVERRLAEVVIERDVLAERMEKAEAALASGRDLGSDVNAANERVGKVLGDLKNANVQIKELEEEVMRADERIDVLEHDLREEKKLVNELERELRLKSDELSQTLEHINVLEGDLKNSRAEIERHKQEALRSQEDDAAAVEHIENITEQLAVSQERLELMAASVNAEKARADLLESEAQKASELAKQLEDALRSAEDRMRSGEEEIASYKGKVASLERQIDRHHAESNTGDSGAQAQIESLEAELDEANKEVARLSVLVSQSPSRKAMEKAKDAKIEMLEQERDDLLERLKAFRTGSLLATPGKTPTSKLSPMARHILTMTLRSPKTPGGPLRELSWLQTTMNDPTVSPLVAEIERLQLELERANDLIDTKLDRIEDAGIGVISLTEQLENAKTKIAALESEISQLTRQDERRTRRLEKLRCQKCMAKVDTHTIERKLLADESSVLEDSSMTSEPLTPPTRTSEKLRADLDAVNAQLASMKKQWEEERRKLVGDNAALQDAAKRLNAEVRQAKNESERTKAGMQGELDRAKRSVEDLERALRDERSRLRALNTEQDAAQRQKDEVAIQLQRAESDMTDIRDQLQRIKLENRTLENELRSNSNVDQKARLLEGKVVENTETIEQLRKERSLLVTDHKSLQRQFTQVTEQVNKLREERLSSQASHDQRRHELDLKVLEIEDLRRALSDRAEELERVAAEKAKAVSEKSDLDRDVAGLEADLRRVKREAEAFGRDLKALRAQKDKLETERREERSKAERVQKQSQTEIRLLRDEAREHKEKVLVLQRQWSGHICAADNKQLDTLRARHKEECKGLIVQIRYLKAKFTRESTMRSDLCNQKHYLLVLLARNERNEQKILAAIAKIGFPVAPEQPLTNTRRRKTLRSVAHTIIFLQRAKRASEAWREQSAAKDAIAAAYQEVRRRREPGTGSA